jgi:hypothetical protein
MPKIKKSKISKCSQKDILLENIDNLKEIITKLKHENNELQKRNEDLDQEVGNLTIECVHTKTAHNLLLEQRNTILIESYHIKCQDLVLKTKEHFVRYSLDSFLKEKKYTKNSLSNAVYACIQNFVSEDKPRKSHIYKLEKQIKNLEYKQSIGINHNFELLGINQIEGSEDAESIQNLRNEVERSKSYFKKLKKDYFNNFIKLTLHNYEKKISEFYNSFCIQLNNDLQEIVSIHNQLLSYNLLTDSLVSKPYQLADEIKKVLNYWRTFIEEHKSCIHDCFKWHKKQNTNKFTGTINYQRSHQTTQNRGL